MNYQLLNFPFSPLFINSWVKPLFVMLIVFQMNVYGQSVEFEGDWLVKYGSSGGHALKILFFPNVSSQGEFTNPTPIKVYAKPKYIRKRGCRNGWNTDLNGTCWKCPSGYNRTAESISSPNACSKGILGPFARAIVDKECPTANCSTGEYEDLGKCYTCPKGFRMQPLESSSSYRKCVKSFSSLNSFESYYSQTMLERLFTPKQVECMRSGVECYVAPISFGLNFRYGWFCGSGYGRGEGGGGRTSVVDRVGAIDNIDRSCQLHDSGHWDDYLIGDETNVRCANELNLKNAINIVLQRGGLSPEERYAGKSILNEFWFVGNIPCPPNRFRLDDRAEIDRKVNVQAQ